MKIHKSLLEQSGFSTCEDRDHACAVYALDQFHRLNCKYVVTQFDSDDTEVDTVTSYVTCDLVFASDQIVCTIVASPYSGDRVVILNAANHIRFELLRDAVACAFDFGRDVATKEATFDHSKRDA